METTKTPMFRSLSDVLIYVLLCAVAIAMGLAYAHNLPWAWYDAT